MMNSFMSEPTASSSAATSGRPGQPLTSREYLAQQDREQSGVPDRAAASAVYDDPQPEMADDATDFDQNAAYDGPNVNLPDSELKQSRIAPGMYRPQPEMVVVDWQAPTRVFKKRTKRFFTTVIVIGLLISLILFFAGQVLPIAVIFSIVFLVYVLSVVPPNIANHSITTFGIHIDAELYYWQELGRFWFETKHSQPLVNIEMARFPGRLTLLLGDQTEETIRAILAEVLLEERPPLSQFEKMAEWVEQHIPLDID
jgi:hypothetical protein